jgi:hypothetical protein
MAEHLLTAASNGTELAAPDCGGSSKQAKITSVRWNNTFSAVQTALAIEDCSNEKLTAAIAGGVDAFDGILDELTFYEEFLDDVANHLRTARARLHMVNAVSVHPKAS